MRELVVAVGKLLQLIPTNQSLGMQLCTVYKFNVLLRFFRSMLPGVVCNEIISVKITKCVYACTNFLSNWRT